jgi:hypothetical protein
MKFTRLEQYFYRLTQAWHGCTLKALRIGTRYKKTRRGGVP